LSWELDAGEWGMGCCEGLLAGNLILGVPSLHRLGFLDSSSHTELQQVATETAKVLNGLLRSLRSM
jgi:hypothetical protein